MLVWGGWQGQDDAREGRNSHADRSIPGREMDLEIQTRLGETFWYEGVLQTGVTFDPSPTAFTFYFYLVLWYAMTL